MSDDVKCPVDGCEHDARMHDRDHPKPKRAVLESTRSRQNQDAHRDFDGFDVNEELARLRRSLLMIKMGGSAMSGSEAADFAIEAMRNIDEYIVRGGVPPKAWAAKRGKKDEER